MAGYHYKLEIVPSEGEILHDENYWTFQQPHPLMLEEFRKIFPNDNTWGETEEFRSDTNYSVLNVWWEEGKVWSIFVEFAPEDKGKDVFLDEILHICKKYQYVLYSHASKNRVQPTKEELWKDFKLGHQYSMYKDRMNEFH